MRRTSPAYLSYLLRLWRTDSHWHVLLTDPVSGKRTGFASVERMVAFLQRQMDARQVDPESGPHVEQGPDTESRN